MKFNFKVIAFSILAGLLVWLSDVALDHFFFSGESFLNLLIIDVPKHKLFIRILIILYFFLFGGVIAAYANKHKKSTEELQDYEFKYKTIADKASNWEFWKNTKGDYNYLSPAFERITGYLVEDLKQNPSLMKKIIHPDDLKRVTGHFEDEVKNTMEITELEFKIVTQNNAVKKIKHTCQPVYDNDGKFKGTRGSNIEIPPQTIEHSIDTTEFKKTVDDLTTSEELFKALFENAPDAFFTHDVKGTLINGNKAAEKLTGYKREELIGKNFLRLKLLNISDAVKAARLLAENALGNPAGPKEFTINMKDGKKVPVEIRNFPIKIGNRILVFGVARDISERKQAEEEIEFLSRFPDENPDPVLRVNTEGIVYYANIASDVLLKKWKTSVGGKLPDSLIQSVTNIIAESGSYKFEETCDEKIFEIRCVPIKNYGYINFYACDVTKRKRAEVALRENEERFRTIFETAQDTIFIKDRNLRYTQVNPSMEGLFDLPTEKFIGRTNEDLFGKETGVQVSEVDSRVLSGEIVKEENTRLVQGIPRTFHIIKVPIRDESGQITGLCGIARDITDRKQVEEALRESEEKYRLLFESIPDAIITIDENGTIISANNGVKRIFGYEPSELLGKPVDILAPEELRPKQKDYIVKAINKGFLESQETIRVDKDGRRIPIDISVFTSKDRSGKILGVSAIMRDITERKQSEMALQESEERFRGLYENSMLGIFRSNPEGKIIMANPTAIRLLGYANFEEISKIKAEDGYCSPSGRKRFREIMDREGTIHGFEIKWKRPDGTCVDLRESARTITGTDGKVIYYEGVFEDITEKKRAEEELIKAKEKAEEMSSLKSNFLANMSHELRTPLVGILGYAEIIQSEVTDDDQKEMINAIIASGNRLMNTLNSILELSKVEAEKKEIKLTPMEIAPIVINTVEAFKSEAENKNLLLKTFVVNKNVVSLVDEKLLKQVISNLVSNALKYTEKGIVEIVVESSENLTESVIKVIDTGIGIRPEDQKIIFEEFRQASEGLGRHFEGAGLGLTITKRFVKLMNGEIFLESEFGKGSVFTVTFPSTIAEPGNKEIIPEEPVLASTNEQKVEIEADRLPRILLVEDDRIMRDAVKRILKTSCLLDTAVNGADSILMAGKNNYDIILMDINLGPGINGLKAASTIRKIAGYENTPIVALTAYAMVGDNEKFLLEGCTHYLSKPFSGKDIIGIINKILRRNKTVQVTDTGI